MYSNIYDNSLYMYELEGATLFLHFILYVSQKIPEFD